MVSAADQRMAEDGISERSDDAHLARSDLSKFVHSVARRAEAGAARTFALHSVDASSAFYFARPGKNGHPGKGPKQQIATATHMAHRVKWTWLKRQHELAVDEFKREGKPRFWAFMKDRWPKQKRNE